MRCSRRPDWGRALVLALVLGASQPIGVARAVLDIEDRGPVLDAGGYVFRVTNAGIVGNAFYDVGLSFDPSFEYPALSGNECLNWGALWIGARVGPDDVRVSGAPNLEWRPTQAEDDRVRTFRSGDLGTERMHDDDGDGRVDEEWPDGRDDDGDGRVDEDLALEADQVLTAAFSDMEPIAEASVYPNGEKHRPLQFSVRQTAMAWREPALQGIAALRWEITYRGSQPLEDVYIGFYADLDSRARSDRAGHLNDRATRGSAQIAWEEPPYVYTAGGQRIIPPDNESCAFQLGADYVVIRDGVPSSKLPAVAVVPLDHTTDPLGWIPAGRPHAIAPRSLSFRTSVFQAPGRVIRGQAPVLESERYDALRGRHPEADLETVGDPIVLVSCGPFRVVNPGTRIEMTVALVAGATVDSVNAAVVRLLESHHGILLNLVPEEPPAHERDQYLAGVSGTFGHEVCIEPPPGVTFTFDPHCTGAIPTEVLAVPERYEHGRCVWTNADCNWCTGRDGMDTRMRWIDAESAAPSPEQRSRSGDRRITVEWDNWPEVLADAGRLSARVRRVLGYRVYKLVDWRGRQGELPPRRGWALFGAYTLDPERSRLGEIPLTTVTDTTVGPGEVIYERRRYPAGRYRVVDPDVHNGFDYAYRVTTVVELDVPTYPGTPPVTAETPWSARFEHVVRPRSEARERGSPVWVVPNPYRARADWNRPAVPGDPLPGHVDFMGMPRARATIRIWTVAGDFVAQVDHDGTDGHGQASWNLVSRNGQDIESGIYLFTVESALGNSIGRFVIVR